MNIADIRQEFPIFQQDHAPVYLDSAATSQKPKVVIERVRNFYCYENANVHRGIYRLSEAATTAFESCREKLARFINASCSEEIIFTRGTTEAVNLVANSWAESELQEGDEILLSVAEHHSNLVPWQMVAKKYGATLKHIPLTKDRRLDLDQAEKLFSKKTKMLAVAHVSNVLGVIHPVERLVKMARNVGAKIFIDGAQGVVHMPVDVKALDCDFYAFSGHKLLAPTGVGVLFGKKSVLSQLPPYQGGGDMIEQVGLHESSYADLPNRFEAGTPAIASVIGLESAIDFLGAIPRKEAFEHEKHLASLLLEAISQTKAQALIEPGDDWVGVVPFYHPDIHPHDLASVLDSEGVCIRAGHHCAQPLMQVLGQSATARVSPYIYNNEEDVEAFARALAKAEKLFA